MKKVIRGGTIVTATDTVQADVLIDGETVAAIGSFDGVDAEPIDASGCYVLPGLIDNHTHLSMPFGGTWTNDDYDTGTQAAAAGGVTCLVDFALQMHPGGLRSSLEEWQGARRGRPRTSTTASTWRSRRPTTARSPTCRRWSTRASRRSRSSSPTAAR